VCFGYLSCLFAILYGLSTQNALQQLSTELSPPSPLDRDPHSVLTPSNDLLSNSNDLVSLKILWPHGGIDISHDSLPPPPAATVIPEFTSQTSRQIVQFPSMHSLLWSWISKASTAPVTRTLPIDSQSAGCWDMQGSSGTVGILLGSPILIVSITIGHEAMLPIPSEKMSQTPQAFTLWALVESETDEGDDIFGLHDTLGFVVHMKKPSTFLRSNAQLPVYIAPSRRFIRLHDFRYQLDPHLPHQKFNIHHALNSRIRSSVLVLEVNSNYGSPNATSLCLVSVHGSK